MESAQPPRFRAPLDTDTTTDVAIIGAGITGLSTAYLLTKAGRKVTLIDAHDIGQNYSGMTTAHLTSVIDPCYRTIRGYQGRKHAGLAAESHRRAIDLIESICREAAMDCDFRRIDGFLFPHNSHAAKEMEKELEAARKAGLQAELVTQPPWATFRGPCIRFPDQGQFHPVKYMSGLANAIQERGGRIYSGPHATGVEDSAVITSDQQRIRAQHIVIATYLPINSVLTALKQTAYLSYAIGLSVSKGYVPSGLYWDTDEPYHYVRLHEMNAQQDVLIVGGEDHKTGRQQENHRPFQNLQAWARSHFPEAGEVLYQWAGEILEPHDGLALIGKSPDHDAGVFIATGYSGNGMTYGSIAAMLLTDLILGRPNAWAQVYDPGRVSLRAAAALVAENVGTAGQYASWLTSGHVEPVNELKHGQGGILRQGLKKLAVYKDQDGTVSCHSAVCTHLGCIVEWNDTEQTFDCPCHGSRFSAMGEVLNGPAVRNLEKETLKESSAGPT